jgi:hypothetical protein
MEVCLLASEKNSFGSAYHLFFFNRLTVPCRGELTNATNTCYVIDGTLTLFSNSEFDEALLDSIPNLIQTAMNNGDYDNADPNIIHVSYREDLENDAEGIDGETATSSEDDDTLSFFALVFVGFGALLTLVFIFLLVGRRYERYQESRLTGRYERYQESRLTGSFPTADDQTEIRVIT